MLSPQLEDQRLLATRKLLSLPFNRNESLQEITNHLSFLLETPVSMVTLLDKDTLYIINTHGIQLQEMPRATSFCTHAIEKLDLMVIEDTNSDNRFNQLPLVVHAPHVRFYAGMPIHFN